MDGGIVIDGGIAMIGAAVENGGNETSGEAIARAVVESRSSAAMMAAFDASVVAGN